MSKKIGTPSVPTSKPEVLSGRRAMLSRTLVGVVGGLVQQQVTAKTIPPLEPDYVQ